MISGIDKETGQPLALTRTPKKVLDREDFMLLFIKQLQYQDPMKPIENNEMAMQMALFSQVDQLFDLNENFEKLLKTAENQTMATLVSLVGKRVKVEGDKGRVENGHFLGAEFELKDPANRVEVVITRENGEIVKRLDLGALPAGTHRIQWDATDENGQPVPDGNYRIKVILPDRRKKTSVPVRVYGRVTGAVLGEENKVLVNETMRVGLDEILEILDS